MRRHLLSQLFLLFAAAGFSPAAVVVTSTPYYRSIEDSPFYSEIAAGRGYFETFETGEFLPYAEIYNIRFVTLSAGNVPDHAISVDADDGRIDGIDFYRTAVTGISLGFPNPDIPVLMTFTPNQFGQHPRWFGLVYTAGGGDAIQLDILGVGGAVLASVDLDPLLSETLNRHDINRPTNDDTLFGFVSDQEIFGFRMTHVTFLSDHYQWGYNVPEPSGAVLTGLFAAAVLLRRPRRRP